MAVTIYGLLRCITHSSTEYAVPAVTLYSDRSTLAIIVPCTSHRLPDQHNTTLLLSKCVTHNATCRLNRSLLEAVLFAHSDS